MGVPLKSWLQYYGTYVYYLPWLKRKVSPRSSSNWKFSSSGFVSDLFVLKSNRNGITKSTVEKYLS